MFVKLYHFFIILTWLLYILYIVFFLILYYIIYIYIYINYIILLYIICFMLWSDNLLFLKKLLYVYNDVYDNKHFLHIMHMPVRVHVSRTFPVLN